MDAHRPRDVLERLLPEIDEGLLHPVARMFVRRAGQDNPALLTEALKPRGDVHAVAHKIAVALLDHVAQVNADAKLDALFGRQAGVSLEHPRLHFDRAANCIDHAAKLDDRAVASALDDPPVAGGNGRVDQVAAQRPQPRERSLLVGAGEPAEAHDIGDQDRCNLAGLADRAPLAAGSLAQRPAPIRPSLPRFRQ
jgi:hypothetical protein